MSNEEIIHKYIDEIAKKLDKVERRLDEARFVIYFSMCFILNNFLIIQFFCTLTIKYGDIAQLARAPALQAGGQGFDSLYLHHKHHTYKV